MNFYETKTGRCFFDVQLPNLIQALEDISGKLSQKQAAVRLPVEVPENFLEELYYGNLKIGACSDERYQNESMGEIVAAQEELKTSLTLEQWEHFLKFSTRLARQSAEESCRMFQHGFQLAVKLMAAGLGIPKLEEGEKINDKN